MLLFRFSVLSFAVSFLSSFPASLPQPLHRCSLPLCSPFGSLCFPVFPFPSVSFRPLPFRFRLLSLCFFRSCSSPFRLTVAPGCSAFRLSASCLSPSFPLPFVRFFSGSHYLAFCSFPFVLSCFAPTAVPQVLPFQISPRGPVPDFRFLSSASVLASHYSALCSSFSTVFPFSPHLGFSGAPAPLSLPRFSPSFRPGFPCLLSGSVYSAFCLFPFALPCFAPTAVRQVLAWLSSPFGSLCFSNFPFFSASFRPLLFRFRLLGLRFFLSLLP